MNYSYTIPHEYHACVAEAIKEYATKSYTDETIKKMVQKSQSVANSGFLVREDTLSLFRGKFAEWLACIEYNSLKNSGSVIMTIVNPDETSKADLLHFIKVGDEFKAVAGPDIKSGGSTYVFNQWKKIVTSRYDIPMVDFDDVLTTEEGLKQLTKSQRAEFDELSKQYPKKKPIPSAWSNQDELRLRMDYFKSVMEMEGSFEYSPEIVPILKKALANQAYENLQELDWTEFNKKCKKIFKEADFSVESMPNTNSVGEKSTVNANRSRNINTVDKKAVPKVSSVKSTWKLSKATKIITGVVVGGATVGGALLATKNPEQAKKIISGLAKNPGSKKMAVGSVLKNAKITQKAVGEAEASLINSKTVEKIEEEIKRASPILHKVKGYFRANGTFVEGYMRGKK